MQADMLRIDSRTRVGTCVRVPMWDELEVITMSSCMRAWFLMSLGYRYLVSGIAFSHTDEAARYCYSFPINCT